MNAFMVACQNGHTQIVELLLTKQVVNDLNASNKYGRTALMIATQPDNSAVVKLLLEAGADPNIQIESSTPFMNGATALIMASIHGHIQTVQLLLKAGADPNKAAMTGETALGVAVTLAHYEIVDELIKAGASTNISTTNPINNTTIDFTVTQCCVMVIAVKNAPVNEMKQMMQNFMPKQLQDNPAIIDMGLQEIRAEDETKHIKVLKLLLEVTPQPEDDPYSLLAATAAGCTPAVELLLKAGYDPSALRSSSNLCNNSFENTNISDCNALMVACQKGYIEIVQLMLQGPVASTNMSIYYPIINTTIDWTITQWCVTVIAMKNITVNEMNEVMQDFKLKDDILNSAIVMGLQQIRAQDETKYIKILQLLLEVTPQPEDDPYSLIAATAAGCTPAVELLLKAGYDPLALQSSSRLCNNILKSTAVRPTVDCNALTVACQQGHIKIVKLLILQGPVDLNATQDNVLTPLMAACTAKEDNLEIVRLLLEAGAHPNVKSNIKDINELTALACAVISGNKIIVHELLTAGANNISIEMNEGGALIEVSFLCVLKLMHKSEFEIVQSQSPSEVLEEKYENNNEQIFEVASKTTVDDTIEILRLLLEAASQPEDDPASLLMASGIGNVQAVELFLQAGYNPMAPLSSSKFFQILTIELQKEAMDITCPSLVIACNEGHLEVVQLLLKEIKDPNHQQKTGETFLMAACDGGHKDIVLTLLENGADPNICDNNGDNALHHALYSSSSEDHKLDIIKTLLSWNTNINGQNNHKVTPLMIASGKGYTEVLVLLLEEADPNITDSKGRTALMHASMYGQSEAVALLLMTYNADPSVTDNYGSTALCYAAYGRCIQAINVLLNNHNPNQEETEKAFTAACYGGHKESIKLLADKLIITNRQKDILTACVSDDMTLFVQVRAKEASSDLCTPLIESTGLTPLMIAASCGSDGVVQTLLLRYGADVNQQDTYLNYTPLLCAVSGSKSIVQYLLDSGANVNDISKEEMTPLDIARVKELNEIAQLLESNGAKTYSLLKANVEKVTEEFNAKQKAEVLQGMPFPQMQTLSTTAGMKEPFHVPLLMGILILPTMMVS